MNKKLCFNCYRKLFPDSAIRTVTLGRECMVCHAATERGEPMVSVDAALL